MIVGFFPATTMPDAEWWQALWPDPGKVVAEMGAQPSTVVVDLCCGDGLFTVPLARIAGIVYAIDIDSAMLDRARAVVAAAGTTKPAGPLLSRAVELPPYHYGVVFQREEGSRA